MRPRARGWLSARRRSLGLATGCALAACTELQGRALDASAEASLDAPLVDGPDVVEASVDARVLRYDARPCPAGPLRVDGVVNQYYPSDPTGMMGPFGATAPRALVADDRDGAFFAGHCAGCDAAPRAVVWKVLSTTGQSDSTWGANSRAFDGDATHHTTEFWSLLRDADGRLLAGGYSVVGGLGWPTVSRFLSDGSADASFGDHGRLALDPNRFGGSLTGGYVLRALADPGGVFVVGVDEPPTERPGTRALLARLRSDGTLDPTFAKGGLLRRDDLRGCFDALRDGADLVALCQSIDRRPLLLRLDARGAESPWAGFRAHPAAPVWFQGRTLLRDSAGSWVVVGAVNYGYLDDHAPPAAVRYTPEGEPDFSYGVEGLAQLSGARQTPRYTYANAAALACEDRLLVGANLDEQPLVAVLDRDGHPLRAFGDRGYLRLPIPRGVTTAAVNGIAPLGDGGRALVLVNYLPASFSLVSLGP